MINFSGERDNKESITNNNNIKNLDNMIKINNNNNLINNGTSPFFYITTKKIRKCARNKASK